MEKKFISENLKKTNLAIKFFSLFKNYKNKWSRQKKKMKLHKNHNNSKFK